jgi:hypothetical protein
MNRSGSGSGTLDRHQRTVEIFMKSREFCQQVKIVFMKIVKEISAKFHTSFRKM